MNVIIALLFTIVIESGPRRTHHGPYALSGFCQVAAKYTTTCAMVHGVSFPVVNLAKASKMVPVMAGSLFLGNAKYSFMEFFDVALIVAGTVVVGATKEKNKSVASSSWLGVVLLVSSLACDGLVAGVQKRSKKAMQDTGNKARNFEMQLFTNLYMCIGAGLCAFLFGEFPPALAFCASNPEIFSLILKFSLCSAIGQVFIFFTLTRFDPLVCTTITTSRKVLSVLFSILFKGHRLTTQGWVGVIIATVGIAGELVHKARSGPSSAATHTKT
jgi:UDP-galactose transporter B1